MHLGHDAPEEPLDPVAKIFGVDAEDLLSENQTYTKQGNAFKNTSFWQDAGPEEMVHLYSLIEQLSDDEVREVARLGGIKPLETDIDTLKGWPEEVGREDFFKVYNKRNSRND